MSYENKLHKLVKDHRGIIKTADALNIGITKPTLYKYLDEHNFTKVCHGIFASPKAELDNMYVISLRSKQVVYSHDSALYLHKILANTSDRYTVTVKTGYNPSKLTAEGIKVFTIKPDLHDLGLIYVKTDTGFDVPTYNIERTLCDVIRSRSDMDARVFQMALRSYAKRTDRNIKLLMEYARVFRVDKILVKYLEVLL